MKNLLLVFGALLVVSGIVSANLWRDLRSERQANMELRTQLAEVGIAARSRAPAAEPASEVLAQTAAVPLPIAASETPVAAVRPVSAQDGNFGASQVSAAVSASFVAAVAGSGEKDLMKDPEYRKAQLTQTRLRLAQSNPGLAETLGLSEQEANHLFEVMAENQLKLSAEFTAMATAAGGSPAAMTDVLRRAGATEDPARAVLGEAKYAQYQEYQRNVRPALTQVANMGSTLTTAGQPLNEAQSRALTTVMLAETQRQRQEAAIQRPNPNPGAPRQMADTLAEALGRQEENNRRVLEAATPHLSNSQIAALQQQFEQEAASRRRTVESARELDSRRQTLPLPQILQATPR